MLSRVRRNNGPGNLCEIQVEKEDTQRGRKEKTKQNKAKHKIQDSVAIQKPREEHFKRSGQLYQILIRSNVRAVDDTVCHQITLPGLNRSFFQLPGVLAAHSFLLTHL